MVGFAPGKLDFWTSNYKWNDACVGECVYNLIFTSKGAFLSRNYYALYNSDAFQSLREIADKSIPGEDLLMSYVFYSEHFLVHQKEPTLVIIQADEVYEGNIYEGPDRFSLIEKIRYVTDFISHKIYKTKFSLNALNSQSRTEVTSAIEKFAKKHSPSMILPPHTGKWYIANNHGGSYVEKPCSNGIHLSCSYNNVNPFSVILWMAKAVLKDVLLFTVLVILGFSIYIYKAMPGRQSRFDVHGRYAQVEMQSDISNTATKRNL
mmetsp:Transcript_26627/g.32286  ORF Transcript_26627/g.32286 Transcript_26627/m.32286 type:complete len:263 (-) Transcript_26627:87-875(-)